MKTFKDLKEGDTMYLFLDNLGIHDVKIDSISSQYEKYTFKHGNHEFSIKDCDIDKPYVIVNNVISYFSDKESLMKYISYLIDSCERRMTSLVSIRSTI